MVGGDLHWIWEPYSIYQEVDYVRIIHLAIDSLNLPCISR